MLQVIDGAQPARFSAVESGTERRAPCVCLGEGLVGLTRCTETSQVEAK